MRVSHYFELENVVTGGIAESARNQRKALDRQGIKYTEEADLDADVLHLNLPGPRSVYLARKARKNGVPVVMHTHQTAEDFRDSFRFSNLISKPMRPYLEYAYSLADVLVCPSEFNRREMESYTDVKKKVITNGFDREKLEGFGELREKYLERYDLEPPVVFMVGHVLERKGLETFIETARELPELDFAWFGYLNPTQSLSGRLLQPRRTKKLVDNSPDNVTFTGFIEDVRGAFAAGDIFFFPTWNENEGIALLEAMGAGKPVVVRDIETFGWLEDGKNALKTHDDFATEIRKLEDEKLRDRIGSNAEEKSREFQIDKVGEELEELYRAVT